MSAYDPKRTSRFVGTIAVCKMNGTSIDARLRGPRACLASVANNVRFWYKADIGLFAAHVCF